MTKTRVFGIVFIFVVATLFAIQPAQARVAAVATDTEISWTVKGKVGNVLGFRIFPKGAYSFLVSATDNKRTYSMKVPFSAAGTRISVAREVCNRDGRCRIRFSRPTVVQVDGVSDFSSRPRR